MKRIERLARFKTEADYHQAFFEAQQALSKRAEPTRLAEDAKPEQVAEWRKALGLKEVAADAKPQAFMEAYGIAIPEGYEASALETGMVADYARHAYGKGRDPAVVQEAVSFFFQQQQAAQQAANRLAVERQQAWTRELQAELGRDHDAMVAASEAYLNQMFAEDEQTKHELLRAQLPGGGYLGDHPAFVKMVTDLALANGFTDRIEANAMESGGKSLEQQHQEIEQLMLSDPERYNAAATQERLRKIIGLRLKRGEIDEQGEPVRQRRRA